MNNINIGNSNDELTDDQTWRPLQVAKCITTGENRIVSEKLVLVQTSEIGPSSARTCEEVIGQDKIRAFSEKASGATQANYSYSQSVIHEHPKHTN